MIIQSVGSISTLSESVGSFSGIFSTSGVSTSVVKVISKIVCKIKSAIKSITEFISVFIFPPYKQTQFGVCSSTAPPKEKHF